MGRHIMTLGRSAVHITLSILFIFVFLTAIPPARAELTLTSAYPTLGKVDVEHATELVI